MSKKFVIKIEGSDDEFTASKLADIIYQGLQFYDDIKWKEIKTDNFNEKEES